MDILAAFRACYQMRWTCWSARCRNFWMSALMHQTLSAGQLKHAVAISVDLRKREQSRESIFQQPRNYVWPMELESLFTWNATFAEPHGARARLTIFESWGSLRIIQCLAMRSPCEGYWPGLQLLGLFWSCRILVRVFLDFLVSVSPRSFLTFSFLVSRPALITTWGTYETILLALRLVFFLAYSFDEPFTPYSSFLLLCPKKKRNSFTFPYSLILLCTTHLSKYTSTTPCLLSLCSPAIRK